MNVRELLKQEAQLKQIIEDKSKEEIKQLYSQFTNYQKRKLGQILKKKYPELKENYKRFRQSCYRKQKGTSYYNKSQRERLHKQDCSNGKRKKWEVREIQRVLADINMPSPQLAIIFECSVPAIMAIKRKIKLVEKLHDTRKLKPYEIAKLAYGSEKKLKLQVKSKI